MTGHARPRIIIVTGLAFYSLRWMFDKGVVHAHLVKPARACRKPKFESSSRRLSHAASVPILPPEGLALSVRRV